MVKVKKVLVAISMLFLASMSLGGTNGDEDLLKQAKQIFSPLPKLMLSEKNSITPEKVRLGKLLFYETRISVDGTVSCSKCHPISLYGADGLRKAIGNNCRINPRNSPTLFNAAGQISEHWIGNRIDVEDQAKQSVLGPPSFGMPSYEAVEKKLKEIKGYITLFKNAFPADSDSVTVDNFAKAVGAFERTLVTPSPFDAFLEGNPEALKEQEKRGLKTFIEVGCVMCHSGAYFGGQMYQKFGFVEPYWKYTKSQEIDEGRYAVTKNESDKYVFKVSMLRNVAKTPPYFHDGSIDKLEIVELIMGKVQLGRDLTESQIEGIAAFLKSLTGEIPKDAMKIPLLPSME
jgi:cytochrome c peroxidase